MADYPGVRRSGRARQQTTTMYDEARSKAEEEEAELSDAASASSTSSSPRGAETKGKGKGKGAKATKKASAVENASSDDDEEGSVASASASKKRKRRSSSAAAAAAKPKPKPKPKPAAKTAGKDKGKGKGKGKKAAAAETSDDYDSDDDDSGSEAGLDKLMDERRGAKGGKKGAKGGGKGSGGGTGRAAPLSKLKEGEMTCVLFEHLARNVPVEQRMKAWVRAWLAEEAEREESGEEEEGGGPCVIDMFNFLLWCAGARKSYADREAELLPEVDSAEWEALMGGVVQDLREGGGPNYPLLEKAAKHRGFRERFAQAWHALVGAARDGHRHHVEALRRVLEVVHGLCECPLVSVRHTACYAGLQLGDALVRETVALSTKADVAARQLEAERRKGAGKGRKAKDLGRDIDEYAAHVSELEAVLEEVFNSIFATRYRDVNERVRVDCLEGLGAFLRRYPSMFLKDQFIKYLGWMLYDKADAVRAAAARVLLGLYAEGGNLPKLENFTARFLGRMQGLVHDVDEGVRVLAVRILRRLQDAGYLDDAEQEQLDEVDELLLDPAWGLPLRKEATLFFADHVDGFNDEEGDGDEEDKEEEEDADESGAEMEEEGSKSRRRSSAASKAPAKGKGGSKKKGKGGGRKSTGSAAAAKGGGARARRGVIRRLVTVVQFLDYHLRPGMTADDGEDGEEEQAAEGERPWPEAYDRLVATCVESFEQHPQGGFLYDWPTYFALLQDPAGPVAQPNVAGGLTDREQALLIRLMAAAVKRAAAAGAGGAAWVQAEAAKAKEPPAVTGAGLQAGAGGKADKAPPVTAAERAAARARQEGLAAALEAFTSGAVEELPRVLRRYKTDAGKLAGLVALPRFLQREAITGKRHKGHFEALLKLLKEVYLQGTDPAALRDVAAALAHLRAEDEARVHNVGAVLQAVVGDLLGRLAGDTASEEQEEQDDDDADFNTGLVLLQLGTLAKRLDLAEFLGDGGGAEALQQQLGEEAAEALAERVRGVVQARLAGAPEAWGKGFGQALEWRVRVVKEGVQLLYLLLLHSTRGLLRLAMEQRPADSEEAKTKKATTEGAGNGKGKKVKGEEEDKEEDEEEEAGADEELVEGDEDVGVEEAELVLKQRKTLLAVLSAVLSMGSQEAAMQEDDQEGGGEESASQGEGSESEGSQQSQPPAPKGKGGKGKGGKGKAGAGGVPEEVAKAVAEVKTAAYALASDLRFLFRPGIGRYQVLRRVVWAPEPEFLRLLQGHFQREELRYQEAAMRAEAQDKPEEADAADVALVRELLDPLIRSVLYTTEALNRRQAAAIAAHFVHSGPRAAESVKYLLKRLKELDVRSYLEVHMTTLRTCFAKWGAGASDAGMDRFVQLAHRMAQALGVGKLPHATAAHQQLLDSFVRFLKNGVQYATDDAPRRFAFFEGLRFYLAKLPEHKVRDVARLFEERAQELPPAVRAQLEEEQERLEEEPEALVSAEGAWFLTFQQDLAALLDAANGKGKGKGTPSSFAKKRSPRSPRRSGGSASASGGSGKKRARSRSRSTSRSRSPAPGRRGGNRKVSAAEALGHEDGDDEADPIVAADSDEEEEGSLGGGRGKGWGAGRGRRGSASTLASVREGEEDDEEIEEEDDQPKGRASQSHRSGKRRRVSAAASQSSNLDALDESEGEEGGNGGAGGGGESDGEDSVFGDMGPSQKAATAAADAKGKGKKGGRK